MQWSTQPCVFCCISIIQSGIKKVIFKGEYPTGLGLQLLKEAEIEYEKYETALNKEREEYKIKHIREIERAKKLLKEVKLY